MRKPVLNTMALLAKLGSVRYAVSGAGDVDTAILGGIATLSPGPRPLVVVKRP